MPRFLLGSVLVLWGWRTDQPVIAVALAALIESAAFVPWRWNLQREDFIRIANFVCMPLLAGVVIYQVSGVSSVHAVHSILQWLPITVFPLLAAQAYSADGKVPLSALFLTVRRMESANPHTVTVRRVDLGYPFAVLALLASSAGNVSSVWFHAAVTVLAVWALWTIRTNRYRTVSWMALVVAAVALSYAGQIGVQAAQKSLRQMFVSWYRSHYSGLVTDPYQSQTAIGELGLLKQSNRITARVTSPQPLTQPLLLRDGSYTSFHGSTWFADEDAEFHPLLSAANLTTWVLDPASEGTPAARIAMSLNDEGKGMLLAPLGTVRLERLPASRMSGNALGAIKVEKGPPLIDYGIRVAPGSILEKPPGEVDLFVPPAHRDAIEAIAHRLDLEGKPPREVIRVVLEFFHDQYSYSLSQTAGPAGAGPLTRFLNESRSGHCEYFATATVLLLRQAGIPARYATGYAVFEYSDLEGAYLVRRRHAHAWAQPYLEGSWRNFDTTPPNWREAEQASLPDTPLADLLSWIWFRYAKWRHTEGSDEAPVWMLWLLIPLIGFLVWRFSKRERVLRLGGQTAIRPQGPERPGADSPFYAVVHRMSESLGQPLTGETLSQWLSRVATDVDPALRRMLEQHYRYRFDPQGMTAPEIQHFRTEAADWLRAGQTPWRPGPEASGPDTGSISH